MENQEIPKPKGKPPIFGLIILALIVWFIIWAGMKIFSDDIPEKKVYTKSDAAFSSRQFISEKLKSPSSAEFCVETNKTTQLNDTTFIVVSCVDSQNSFGAMLRSNYMCTITFDPSKNMVYCKDIIIE